MVRLFFYYVLCSNTTFYVNKSSSFLDLIRHSLHLYVERQSVFARFFKILLKIRSENYPKYYPKIKSNKNTKATQ